MGPLQAEMGHPRHGRAESASDGASSAAARTPVPSDLRRILELTVPVSVLLARRHMNVESILAIRVGTIIEFNVSFDSELILEVGQRPIGKGHAVKVGENFGLRITRIDPVQARIDAMGDKTPSS